MLLLPRPYPDEIIGSVIARACYQSGMPLKRLIQCIFGNSRSSTSFLMTGDAGRLGILMGLEAMELLEQHTMLPYSIAYMPAAEQARLMAKALKPILLGDCLGSLTKNVSHGVPFRRVCSKCIADELATYGETYWHRAHLLPAVLVCGIHGIRLRISAIPIRGSSPLHYIDLPADVQTIVDRNRHKRPILDAVKSLSLQALNREIKTSNKWFFHYRKLACKKGYILGGSALASQKFGLDVHGFFGTSLLSAAGCDFPSQRRNPWPTLMVREKMPIPFATPKHIFMQAFFELAEHSDGMFGYCLPGPKMRDYEKKDAAALAKIRAILKCPESGETRYTVQDLLTRVGAWHAFRHDRSRFPLTNSFIQDFRSSAQSERQVGGRTRQ